MGHWVCYALSWYLFVPGACLLRPQPVFCTLLPSSLQVDLGATNNLDLGRRFADALPAPHTPVAVLFRDRQVGRTTTPQPGGPMPVAGLRPYLAHVMAAVP